MNELKITLSVPKADSEEVNYLFREIPQVSVTCDDLFSLSVDALLIPINSFGFFEGGLPLQAADRFGFHLQEALQKKIIEAYYGEMLVGQAELLPTRKEAPAYVIAAPLFRTSEAGLSDTVNPYLAVRAAFLAIRGNPDRSIGSLGIPLLGSDAEGMTGYTSARQIRYAVRGALREKPRKLGHLSKAKRRERSLKRKEPKNRDVLEPPDHE